MESLDPTLLVKAFSLACLLAFVPLGAILVFDGFLWTFQKNSFYCKVKLFRQRIDAFINHNWVVRSQYALIIVLTPTLFLLFHSYQGEKLADTFVRLILTPFFVF